MKSAYILVGLALALVVTLALFGLPVGPSLRELFLGAFGDQAGLTRTLAKATPLLLCALGMVVAWKAGMYNIGGEGQFVVGGIAAAAVALGTKGMPGGLSNLGMLLLGALCGGLFAAFPGWLQVRKAVPVVISTILLNFVAIQGLAWSVRGPLQRADKTLPQSDPIPTSAMLAKFDPRFDAHAGVFYGLVAAFALYALLYYTPFGFRLRLVGANPRAARANRIDQDAVAVKSMTLSGALCGLAGAIQLTGVTGTLGDGFAQGWGFLGIPAALLGGLHPLGALASSGFFAGLLAGSENLARFSAGGDKLIYVIQGIAVLAFVGLKSWTDRRPAATAEEPA